MDDRFDSCLLMLDRKGLCVDLPGLLWYSNSFLRRFLITPLHAILGKPVWFCLPLAPIPRPKAPPIAANFLSMALHSSWICFTLLSLARL